MSGKHLHGGRARALALALAIAAALAAPAYAASPNPLRALLDRDVPEPGQSLPATLAGPVDPARYVVGPGDVFLLAVYGPVTRAERLVVSPEGLLFAPEVGAMKVAGLTLSQAREQVVRRLQGALRGVGIQFQLAEPRTFLVYVTGEVRDPGSLSVHGGGRLADVLPESLFTFRASRRRIEVRSPGGSERLADLQRFRLTGVDGGDLELEDGDVIHVPVAREWIAAWGGVGRPGKLELGPADSLGTLVGLAGGLRPDAIAGRALLTRWTAGGEAETTWVALADPGPSGLGLRLRDGDELHVFTQPDYHESERVEVQGRVHRTGTYPIRSGRSHLSEVLAAAGGFLADADSTAVQLLRPRPPGGPDPEFDRLSRLSRGEMTGSEYENFRTRLAALAPAFRVDFRHLARGGVNDPVLTDQDEIRVPEVTLAIRVDGQVRRPGLIEYVPGRPWGYYVRASGGYTARSSHSQVRITRRSNGQTLLAREADQPLPGDFLWVPERTEVSAWQYLKETLIVAAQVATIVIAVRR